MCNLQNTANKTIHIVLVSLVVIATIKEGLCYNRTSDFHNLYHLQQSLCFDMQSENKTTTSKDMKKT